MKLGLVVDLDTCVGCHACAVACKEWNAGSPAAGGVPDYDPYGAAPSGVWFNRVRHYEVVPGAVAGSGAVAGAGADAVAGVCPTGASYKRAEDGIVLVDPERCMGCNYCAWACPYGARELDAEQGVMRKCTLCVDRIHDEALPPAERQPACVLACPAHARFFGDFDDPGSQVSRLTRERGGGGLMEELGYKPVNRYLPPREPPRVDVSRQPSAPTLAGRLAQLVNRLVSL